MKHTVLIVIIAALSLTSCKTSNLFVENQSKKDITILPEVFLADSSYQYHIRKDDKVTISIWGQDELSVGSTYGVYNSNEVYGKWLQVDPQGNIEIPKIGTFHAEKMTIIRLKDSLTTIFSEWIINPIVDIKILNREITVLGEVIEPQVIPVDKEHNTLLELIARCKGLDAYANAKSIKVLRQQGQDVHVANIDLTTKGDYLMKNINLYPGDVVIVPSKKHKEFDKRISTIIPFTTTITAAAILIGTF